METLLPRNLYDVLFILLILGGGLFSTVTLSKRLRTVLSYDLRLAPRIARTGIIFGFFSLIATLLLVFAYAIGPSNLTITKQQLDVGEFTLNQPIKLVVIADLQYKGVVDPQYVTHVVNEVNLQDPDIVIWAGDLIESSANELKNLEVLQQIKARYTKVAILGNHDYGVKTAYGQPASSTEVASQVAQFWQETGFAILRNQAASVDIGGIKLVLAGTDSAWVAADNISTTNSAAAAIQANFRILIAHEPDQLVANPKPETYSLAIAGHCHAGQVNLGLVNALVGLPFYPPGCRKVNNPIGQIQQVNSLPTLITNGIGHGNFRLRLGTAPSIDVIELI